MLVLLPFCFIFELSRCSKCGNESEASSKIEDFYELELNVKGLKSLEESLDDYLSVEELRGDNQYYCESCATRVNATRSIKLRSLPAVLNFQLKRCVFLPNVLIMIIYYSLIFVAFNVKPFTSNIHAFNSSSLEKL